MTPRPFGFFVFFLFGVGGGGLGAVNDGNFLMTETKTSCLIREADELIIKERLLHV